MTMYSREATATSLNMTYIGDAHICGQWMALFDKNAEEEAMAGGLGPLVSQQGLGIYPGKWGVPSSWAVCVQVILVPTLPGFLHRKA